MKDAGRKRNRGLLIVGGVLLACAVLSLGAAAVGGAAFALTQGGDRIYPLSADVSLALPARAASADDEEGIVIGGVVDDGPAARAGVERGDILLALNGVTIVTHRDLRDALEEVEPGDEVEVLVLHGDEERRLRTSLGEQGDRAFLGVIPCCPMQEGVTIHRELDIAADGGALITEVVEGSPAEEAGLAVGDVILAVDGVTLKDGLTVVDAISAHEPGDRVTLKLESSADDEPREITVELGEHPEKEGIAYLGVAYAPTLHRLPIPMPDLPRWVPRLDPESEWFERATPEALRKVTVLSVDPDSPAEDAGLRRGDVIHAVD
ncbi:MAG: PDZ domain-containing protein, partial [Anaerolineae bacterium]